MRKLFGTFAVIVSLVLSLSFPIPVSAVQSNMGVTYQAHVQSIGWQPAVNDGGLAGTVGQSLRMESVKIQLTNAPVGGSIRYEAHVQDIGWMTAVQEAQIAGTEGRSLRMEAIKISLVNIPGYSVQYRVHVAFTGWQPWVSDGEIAGTIGKSLRTEAIEVRVIKVSDNTIVGVQYVGHVQNYGWQTSVFNGNLSGTTGMSLRLEAFRANLVNAPEGGSIRYEAHVQDIGWMDAVQDGQTAGTVGRSLRMEAIKISLVNMPGYSVQYRAHVAFTGWQGWVSDGTIAGTVGQSLRVEAIEVRIVSNPLVFIFPTSLTLSKTTDILNVGSTDTLVPTILPANATNLSVSWVSSDPAVATVNSSGLVTAISAGTTIITATTAMGNIRATYNVTVVVPVSAINITGNNTVVNGQTLQLGATVTPDIATNKTVTWSVTNGTGSATISATGLLTVTGVGTVTVKAVAQDGSLKESTKIITITQNAADLLSAAKTAAHGVLTTALATYTSTNYTGANWTTLTGFKIAGDSAIDATTDSAGVTSAQNSATAGMAGVQTIAADLTSAKATEAAFKSIDYVDYSAVTAALAMAEGTNAEKIAKTTAINNAITALVLKSNLTAYNAALAAVTEATYTPASWATYQLVVTANVVTVANTPEQVATATGNITTAQSNLTWTNEYIAAADKDALAIGYASGDDASSVTQNLTLPVLGAMGSQVSWRSSEYAIINHGSPFSPASLGRVSRPMTDTVVTLTATIVKGSVILTRDFIVTVKGDITSADAIAVEADFNALAIGYANGDSAGSVTQNLNLSAMGTNGSTILWASTNEAVLVGKVTPFNQSSLGNVNRPVLGEADVIITMTANIAKGGAVKTKTFTVTVKAWTNAEALAEALASVNTATETTMGAVLATHAGTLKMSLANYNLITSIGKGIVHKALVGKNFTSKEDVVTAYFAALNEAQAVDAMNIGTADEVWGAGSNSSQIGGTYGVIESYKEILGLKVLGVESVYLAQYHDVLAVNQPVYNALFNKGFISGEQIRLAFNRAVAEAIVDEKITAANANKATAVISVDGSDTLPTTQWVTTEEMTAYTASISAAQAVTENIDATQIQLDNSITALAGATSTYNSAKKFGTRDLAEDVAENAVTEYENGPLTTLAEVIVAEGLKAAVDTSVAAVANVSIKNALELRVMNRAAVIESARTAQTLIQVAITKIEGIEKSAYAGSIVKTDLEAAGVLNASLTSSMLYYQLAISAADNGELDSTSKILTMVNGVNDVNAASLDLAEVTIGYAVGDSAAGVTQNFNLPTTGKHGSQLNWRNLSSWGTPGYPVVTISTVAGKNLQLGKVIQPLEDLNIVLEVSFQQGTKYLTKQITIKVLGNPSSPDGLTVLADKASLEIGYGIGDSASNVTQDLVLPVTGSNGSSIVWTVSPTNTVGVGGWGPELGKVTRGTSNTTTTLTATITKNGISTQKIFTLIIIKL